MTARDSYEACLIELNKVQAPSLLLKDFVYLFNKSIQQYFNKKYNLFEINQQATDDLRVLTNSIRIDKTNGLNKHVDKGEKQTFEDSYDCQLPKDYVHILNVVCEFKDNNPIGNCKNKCKFIKQGASKLTTNQWSSVITNYYMSPSIKQPYYYIVNIQGNDNPPDQIYNQSDYNKIESKQDGLRYGNSSQPIMQIKYGNNTVRYTLEAVYVDYLRAPKYVDLTQDMLDSIEDNSQVLEFPDYVIYEIINEIVDLMLENASNPRVQSHYVINQSIPSGNSTNN